MDKTRLARLMGYGDDVAAMDVDHDKIHEALCAWLGVPSYSLKVAANEHLTFEQRAWANIEEDAVLSLQRMIRSQGLDIPPHEPPRRPV